MAFSSGTEFSWVMAFWSATACLWATEFWSVTASWAVTLYCSVMTHRRCSSCFSRELNGENFRNAHSHDHVARLGCRVFLEPLHQRPYGTAYDVRGAVVRS